MAFINVTKENFEEIKNSDKKVLIDFYATWCGPCQRVLPLVEELSNEHPEYVFAKVDIDDEAELAEEFDVMSVPTLIVLDKGEVVNKSIGSKPKSEILELLK